MKWLLKQFKGLKGKMIAISVLPLLTLIITSTIAFKGFSFIGGMLEESYEVYVPNIRLLGQINLNRANIGYFSFAALLNRNDLKNRENFIALLTNSFSNYKKAVDEYIHSVKISGENEAFTSMKDNYPKYVSLTEKVIDLLKKNTAEADEDILKIIDKGGPWQMLQIEVDTTITKIYDMYTKNSITQNVVQKDKRQSLGNQILSVAIISSLVLLFAMFAFAHRVSASVSLVVQKLNTISEDVKGTIGQLSSSGASLSSASSEAAASLEETVASLEEVSSMVRRNSDNALEASTIAHDSSSVAQEGEAEIKALITSMQQIHTDSKKVEEIIHVIDEIAFQINILALNAAVEAARAGEHGKGFAVVAEAVRSLAHRSTAAAKEINQLIAESVQRTENGRKVADNSGQVLSRIVGSVQKVATLNKEISLANQEQTTGIQQISQAMNSLDQTSQSNAHTAQQVASTAESIATRAVELNEQVQVLKQVVNG